MNRVVNSLYISELSFGYKNDSSKVLEDFSCQIALGSRTAILGLNGSGKTTLLNLLLGSLRPDKGEIILSRNSSTIPLNRLNGAVGFLPQIENIPFDYSVKDYVLLGRAPYIPKFGIPSIKDQTIVSVVLENLHIGEMRNKKLREISGGELQRVRIARILAQKPEIILMDEPTTHLDIKSKKYLYEIIYQLSTEGKTIIYSTHDPFDIKENSDYCILMGKNKKTLTKRTGKLLNGRYFSEYFEMAISI